MQVKLILIRDPGGTPIFSFVPKGTVKGVGFALNDGDYSCFAVNGGMITPKKIDSGSQVCVNNEKLKCDEPKMLAEGDTVEIRQGTSSLTLTILHLSDAFVLPSTVAFDSKNDGISLDDLLEVPEELIEDLPNGARIGQQCKGNDYLINHFPTKEHQT